MKINIFTPPSFDKKDTNINHLNNITCKKWIYCSNGRASLYQILKSLNIKKILIPAYICHTVLVPLKKLNIKPIFYDVDQEDLNFSLDSVRELSSKHGVNTLLVASMYGNPANLVEIEKYCKKNKIFLIDDAAQSFGAKLEDKYVGTFGNAGFFSFSPGKPTAGHMGSFFWSDIKTDIKRTNHFLTHYFRWLDFYINRYKIYTAYNKVYKKALDIISRILLKFLNIDNDNICRFEKNILGGILYDNLNGKFKFRNRYVDNFIYEFKNMKDFRVLKTLRGIPNNHKLVIIFYKFRKTQKFIKYMIENQIYVSNGYQLLSKNLNELPNASTINKCVVEIPIENDIEKMNYIFKKVKEFASIN